MARSFRNRSIPQSFVRGKSRETVWVGLSPTTVVMTGLGGTIVFSLAAPGLALRPFTVVRSKISVYVRSDQEAAAELQMGAVAIAIVTDQASAIGVTAVPTPITDIDSDSFLLYGSFLNAQGTNTGAGSQVPSGHQIDFDSKAMRKVTESDDLIVVTEIDSTSAGVSLLITGRLLFKLH